LALLDERYFGELCFYIDAHDALLRNGAALLDAHAFGEAFDATLEAMDAWKTVRRGSGAGCCRPTRDREDDRVTLFGHCSTCVSDGKCVTFTY
jgi:hypothetical protein